MTNWPRPWDEDVVGRYLTAESGSKSPQGFRKTHLPIDRIYAEKLEPLNITDQFVTERELRDAVLDSEIDQGNRIFILTGETGSGKSQFCEWLKYEINGYGNTKTEYDDYHIGLHISRSETNLDDIIEELAKGLDETPDISDISELDPKRVADAIITTLRAFGPSRDVFGDIDLQAITADRSDDIDLREILIQNIHTYQEGVSKQRPKPEKAEESLNLITEDDYRELSLAAFGKVKRRESVFPDLRDQIHQTFAQNLGIYDFQDQLRQYSEAYIEQDQRPVLIVEDLTTFSVLKGQLLDQIFELDTTSFDVVLGWTTGWEEENLETAFSMPSGVFDYMYDRVRGYLQLTDRNGVAFFMQNLDNKVQLVEKYLTAIVEESDKSFPQVNDAVFDGIYPFNNHFIETASTLLRQQHARITPRVLLNRVVGPSLKSEKRPYEVMSARFEMEEQGGSLETPIRLDYNDQYRELTRWYAAPDPDEQYVELPVAMFDTFNVEISDDMTIADDYVRFEKASSLASIESLTVETADTTETSEDEERHRQVAELQSWLSNGGAYPSGEILRQGAAGVLAEWNEHHPTRLANPNGLRISGVNDVYGIFYTRGDRTPIWLEDEDGDRTGINIELEWGEQYEDLYSQLFIYGLEGEHPESINYDAVRHWAMSSTGSFREKMRSDIEDQLPDALSIEEFIIFLYFLVQNTQSGLTALDRRRLFNGIEPIEEDELPKPLQQTGEFVSNFENLQTYTREIQGLINGFFRLRKNVIDHQRIHEAFETVRQHKSNIGILKEVSPNTLQQAYRVDESRDSGGTNLRELLVAAEAYSKALEGLSEDYTPRVNNYLNVVNKWHEPGQSVKTLRQQFEILHDCLGKMNIPFKEQWELNYEFLQNQANNQDLEEFRDEVDKFENRKFGTGPDLIALAYDFDRSLESYEFWDVFTTIDEVINRLHSKQVNHPQDLKDRIMELDELDEYETQRESLQKIIGDTGND